MPHFNSGEIHIQSDLNLKISKLNIRFFFQEENAIVAKATANTVKSTVVIVS